MEKYHSISLLSICLLVIAAPNFVASFVYDDHVYFWYREWAAEASDSDRQVRP